MLSKVRRFCVAKLPFHEAASKMIESSWTGCTGFRTAVPIAAALDGRDVLFLADGSGGEFAVCLQQLDGQWVQVESFTVPWMKTPEKVAEYLHTTLRLVDAGTPPMRRVLDDITLDEPAETHEPCWACR